MTSSRIPAPVDVLFSEDRILIRRLLGFVDLTEKTSEPATFDLRRELTSYRKLLAKGELPPLTVLKARRRPQDATDGAADRCQASFDVALGPKANFVVLDMSGDWIEEGAEAHIPDAAAQLRERLEGFSADNAQRCRPTLCYLSGEHPRRVQLEVTTHCNLRCGYCNNRLLPQKRHTPLAEVLRILENVDFGQVLAVDLTGLGEALLHPDLPQIVAEIRARRVRKIRLVTNGTTATLERCQRLIEAGLNSISVSLDSLDPDRFGVSRPGSTLEIVRENVIALARFRQSTTEARFDFNLKSVLLDENPYAEAAEILAFSAEHGLDKPTFSTLDPRPAATAHYEPHLAVKGRTNISKKRLSRWTTRRWAKLTSTLNSEKLRPTDQHTLPWIHPQMREDADVCDWAVSSAYIGGDGSCIPCCEQMGDLPRARIGSLFNKSLACLWNDELLYAYRLPLSLGLVPFSCQGCDSAPTAGQALPPGY